MTNIAEVLVIRRRQVIVDKNDIMTVLEALDEIRQEMKFWRPSWDLDFDSYVRVKEPSKWIIKFDSSDKTWKRLIEKLACDDREIVLKRDNKFYLV